MAIPHITYLIGCDKCTRDDIGYASGRKAHQMANTEVLTEKLKELKGQPYIKTADKYILNLDQPLDDFILEITKSVQYILDTKKAGKKDYTGEDWLPTETNNWLKKDATYKEIYEKVIKKLKQ
jgi:hypothetical protein